MSKLTMTIGLPGSGKSRWAKNELKKNDRIKRVNKDDLRSMLHVGHDDSKEKFTLAVRDFVIDEALQRGYDVIVDDTNFAPKHQERFKELAAKHGAEFAIKDFTHVPLKECIKNDLGPNRVSVGKDVITSMYDKYLSPKLEHYDPPQGCPKAIIVDIDGTLAHMIPKKDGGRSPYDYSRVGEDIVDETVRGVVKAYRDLGYKILIVSGRENDCREVTEKWLADNDVQYDYLWMRAAGDGRHDGIVKQEIFDAHIRKSYQVDFVLDDRDRVVSMWRSGDLKVLQVAYGDF